MIYQSRVQWQAKKKQFGVPRSVCKEVDMGDAIQTFNDSLPEGGYMRNPAQTLSAIEVFAPSLFTYAAALKRSAPTNQMNDELARAISTLSSLKKQMASADDPLRFLKQYHIEAMKEIARLKRDQLGRQQATHWDAFYRGPVRNIGLQLDKLVTVAGEFSNIRLHWRAEMNKVNTALNSGVFVFANVDRILTTNLNKVKADLVRAGAWPATRGAIQAVEEPEMVAPDFDAPQPPARGRPNLGPRPQGPAPQPPGLRRAPAGPAPLPPLRRPLPRRPGGPPTRPPPKLGGGG